MQAESIIKEGSKEEGDDRWSSMGHMIWAIWKTKNAAIFHNLKPDPLSTIIQARVQETEYEKARDTTEQIESKPVEEPYQ